MHYFDKLWSTHTHHCKIIIYQARSQTKFSGGAKQTLRGGIMYKNNVFLILLGEAMTWLRKGAEIKKSHSFS